MIGSAAGVAFMGMEKNVSFGWYLKAIGPAALVGYFFGVAGIMGQQAAGLAPRRKGKKEISRRCRTCRGHFARFSCVFMHFSCVFFAFRP